jgi:ectoine hydroxylase-related dioxygenase (phytanoyl-CoA dioxygenase family)
MTALPISASERASGALAPDALSRALAALHDDGFVVLEDVVDRTRVEALRRRMAEDVPRLRARDDAPYNWHAGNLQHGPPREARWLFRDLVCNEPAIAVTSAVLGEPVCALYSGNTALPGSRHRQPPHVDWGHLWPASAPWAPPHGIIINAPLIDMDAGTGGIALWPGSHRDRRMRAGGPDEVPAHALAARRAVSPPVQPSVRAGSLLLRDLRLWHGGMPNPSPLTRPLVAMVHWAPWTSPGAAIDFPREAEPILAHPTLRWHARFVDHAVDHVADGQPHAYRRGDAAGALSPDQPFLTGLGGGGDASRASREAGTARCLPDAGSAGSARS